MGVMELKDLTTYHACILQARAYRVLREFVAKQLDGYDITMMEWVLLGLIHEAGSKGVSPSALSERMDVSLPMITRMLNALNEAGHIRRQTVTNDKRQQLIATTPKGGHLVQDIEGRVRSSMKQWLQDVNRDDLRGYIRIMTQIAERQA